MGFRIIFMTLLLLLQALVYFTFVSYLKTTKIYKPVHRYHALVPFILFNVPFILISYFVGRSFSPPEWFRTVGMIPFYIWHAATFLIAVYLLICKIVKLPFKIPYKLIRIIRPVREKIDRFKSRRSIQVVDMSRRKFIRTATFAVSSYAFIGAGYGIIRNDDFVIDRREIKIDNLPPSLKGLTITLISDIHAGQYMTEKEMRKYAEVVNDLGSDIICIPGDFINFQVEDTKSVVNAFRGLKAKYGVYGSLGNHDFFMDAEYVAKMISNESPIKLLRNAYEKIPVNGHDLYVLGVDDTRDAGAKMNSMILEQLDKTMESAKAGNAGFDSSTKIFLCHKPYGFDDIAGRGIDLTLAGHTHGGQVVPIRFGSFNMSFAALVSKYIEGLYSIGSSNMFVSRGIGSVGLPIRLNCPPEINRLTLV